MFDSLQSCAKDCLEGKNTKIDNQKIQKDLKRNKEKEENANSNTFLADPFLALQNDLDDVSEVIKHNLISEEFVIINNNSPIEQNFVERAKSLELENYKNNDEEEENNLFLNSDSNKEKTIHQIVNLLQQPEKKQHPQLTRQTVSFDDHLIFHSPFSINNCSYEEQNLIEFDQYNNDPMIGGCSYGKDESENNTELCPPLMSTTDNNNNSSLNYLKNKTMRENLNLDGDKQPEYIQENEITIIDTIEPKKHQENILWPINNQQKIFRENSLNESPPPIEPISEKLINKNSVLNISERSIKQELSCTNNIEGIQNYCKTQNSLQNGEAKMLANQEFIQLLLQITPEELEHLRARKALQSQTVQQHQSNQQQLLYHTPLQCTTQPIYIHTDQSQFQYNPSLQNQIYSQQHQSPPLDPLQPSLPYQLDYGISQSINTINNPIKHYGVQQMGQQQMTQPSYFYSSPSSGCSTGTLLSPLSNVGYTSVATSDFLEESDSQMDQEFWAEREIIEGTELNSDSQVTEQMLMGGEEGNSHKEHAPQGRRKSHKTERRTAHNLIEKKYRCSINDRINQLKGMLATEDNTKLSKSATLRRAVENIHALRTKNAELAGENSRLRRALEMAGLRSNDTTMTKMGINTNPIIVGQHSEQPEILLKGPSMQRSRVSSSIKKCTTSISSTNVSSVIGPKDQSRVTLCVFMFLLLIYNPLALFLTESSNSSNIGDDLSFQEKATIFERHRTLSGEEDTTNKIPFSTMSQSHISGNSFEHWPNSSLLRHTLIWLLNCIFVFAILNRLLVSGEPVADRRSPRWSAFLQTRRKAAQAVKDGNWKEAQRRLGESLQILERPLPSSGGLDEWMSLIWQVN